MKISEAKSEVFTGRYIAGDKKVRKYIYLRSGRQVLLGKYIHIYILTYMYICIYGYMHKSYKTNICIIKYVCMCCVCATKIANRKLFNATNLCASLLCFIRSRS